MFRILGGILVGVLNESLESFLGENDDLVYGAVFGKDLMKNVDGHRIDHVLHGDEENVVGLLVLCCGDLISIGILEIDRLAPDIGLNLLIVLNQLCGVRKIHHLHKCLGLAFQEKHSANASKRACERDELLFGTVSGQVSDMENGGWGTVNAFCSLHCALFSRTVIIKLILISFVLGEVTRVAVACRKKERKRKRKSNGEGQIGSKKQSQQQQRGFNKAKEGKRERRIYSEIILGLLLRERRTSEGEEWFLGRRQEREQRGSSRGRCCSICEGQGLLKKKRRKDNRRRM